MSGRLQGRVAIVTGSASGFGRATAVRFGLEGANVIVADLDEQRGREVVDEIRGNGTGAELVVGDVSLTETGDRLVSRAAERWGRLDILVNNAGIVVGDPIEYTWEMSEKGWERLLAVNLKSVYVCCKAAVPQMRAVGAGAIVNVTSIAVRTAVGGAAYAAAKGGMLSYSREVAAELGPDNIRVNCVSPGFMRSPMTTGERQGFTPEQTEERMQVFGSWVPLGRAGAGGDIANAILFLASDEAAYITGQEIVVDGGWSVRGRPREFEQSAGRWKED